MIKTLGKNSTIIIFIVGVLTGIAVMTLYGGENLQQGHENIFEVQENDTDTDTVRVTKVIDGDTIIIDDGEHVRLIGIDTPERGDVYYSEAADRLRALVDGKEIHMKKDVSERDRYGRLLRHIYVDDVWVNAAMIKEGYARFVTFPPDVMHVEAFERLEREARENKRGLWGV